MQKQEVIDLLINHPVLVARKLGFTDLTDLHNSWIRKMVASNKDETLQAHRGSYKTTCVSVAIALIMILFPKDRTMFMRKTDTDTKEIIRQVKKILKTQLIKTLVKIIYDVDLVLVVDTQNELSTNLSMDIKGTSQLVGIGLGGSLTGKHFDRIFTDDIVNLKDRKSRAEREQTKLIYQELQNVKNRGGRIFNTGTPWHKDDCFTIMPEAEKWDCYSTGLIDEKKLDEIRQSLLRSLFCANYELKHIADDDVIFTEPVMNADASLIEQGECHIDASYGGEDYTAFTIIKKAFVTDQEGNTTPKFYVYGRMWHKHIDDVEDEIIELRKKFNAGRIYCEDNGDKGYLGKALRKKGERVVIYHESMNKYVKITSYLKEVWRSLEFVVGTDDSYIDQICDYNIDAEHDDAPDSCASLIRVLYNKKQNDYKPIWNVGVDL